MSKLSRRTFLAAPAGLAATAGLARTAGALGLPRHTTAAAAASPVGGGEVAVLGGGVAGLSAAHELAERGFRVTVYERRALGGKARSIPVPGTGQGGRQDLPGEHGFRFFPGFYRNLPDTMRRIPFPGNANGVFDNLVAADAELIPRTGGRADLPLLVRLTPPPVLDPDTLVELVRALLETQLRLPATEALFFANRLLVYLTSSDARRLGQWEQVAWWDFVRAERMSEDYQRLLAIGLTRNLTAMRAEVASTHTVGRITEAFLFTALGRDDYGAVDRLLNGPTNEVWIDPWVRHLTSLGVRFQVGWSVDGLDYTDGRIAAALVTDPRGGQQRVGADWFVCAVPVERAVPLWNAEMLAADPALARAAQLRTEWMVGLQLYLRRPTPITRGHAVHVDSPWALTSIAQAQFWPRHDFARDFGDGQVRDCLSVIISNWTAPGILFGKPALACDRQELLSEVWAQLKAGLEDTGESVLPDEALHSWFLDPGVTGIGGPAPHNDDPLLVHPVGTWANRPAAVTAIPNFFLAADYVRNDVDLATMEGANEAARAAVNGILDAAGSTAPRCELRTLYEAPEFASLRAEDEVNYRLGLPNVFDPLGVR